MRGGFLSRFPSLVLLGVVVLLASGTSGVNAARSDVADTIRQATGLRFRVVESIIRRNIISTRTPYGFKIKSVDAGSPAETAGLKRGDVLLEWDGQPIKSSSDLGDWIDKAERGKEIAIRYARLKPDRKLTSRRPWQEHTASIVLEPPER